MLKQNNFLIVTLVLTTLTLLGISAYTLYKQNEISQQADSVLEQRKDEAELVGDTPKLEPDKLSTFVFLYNEKKTQTFGDKSLENSNSVSSVKRVVTKETQYRNVIEEIIKGPTTEEQANGYKPTFGKNLFMYFEGESNCGGKDFEVNVSTETKLAIVKFCKTVMLAGDSSSVIFYQQLYRTLAQFSEVARVQVLNKEGQCFDDMRGSTDITDCIYPINTY